MLKLTVVSGPHKGRSFRLQGDEDRYRIGRTAGRIILPDHHVSGCHAELFRGEDGWYICDLDSRNGTLVNRRRVDEPARIGDGDCLQLGQTEMVFHADCPDTGEADRDSPADDHHPQLEQTLVQGSHAGSTGNRTKAAKAEPGLEQTLTGRPLLQRVLEVLQELPTRSELQALRDQPTPHPGDSAAANGAMQGDDVRQLIREEIRILVDQKLGPLVDRMDAASSPAAEVQPDHSQLLHEMHGQLAELRDRLEQQQKRQVDAVETARPGPQAEMLEEIRSRIERLEESQTRRSESAADARQENQALGERLEELNRVVGTVVEASRRDVQAMVGSLDQSVREALDAMSAKQRELGSQLQAALQSLAESGDQRAEDDRIGQLERLVRQSFAEAMDRWERQAAADANKWDELRQVLATEIDRVESSVRERRAGDLEAFHRTVESRSEQQSQAIEALAERLQAQWEAQAEHWSSRLDERSRGHDDAWKSIQQKLDELREDRTRLDEQQQDARQLMEQIGADVAALNNGRLHASVTSAMEATTRPLAEWLQQQMTATVMRLRDEFAAQSRKSGEEGDQVKRLLAAMEQRLAALDETAAKQSEALREMEGGLTETTEATRRLAKEWPQLLDRLEARRTRPLSISAATVDQQRCRSEHQAMETSYKSVRRKRTLEPVTDHEDAYAARPGLQTVMWMLGTVTLVLVLLFSFGQMRSYQSTRALQKEVERQSGPSSLASAETAGRMDGHEDGPSASQTAAPEDLAVGYID